MSGIHVDPANPKRACVSFSGFNAETPATPGLVLLSRRLNRTALAGSASAFVEMKTRPVLVAGQGVDVSAAVRSTAATTPPARSVP